MIDHKCKNTPDFWKKGMKQTTQKQHKTKQTSYSDPSDFLHRMISCCLKNLQSFMSTSTKLMKY